jgi:hypothetical protein
MPSACRRASAVTGRLKSFRLSRVRPSSRLLCEYCRFHRRCCNPFDCNAASFFRGNSTDAAKPQAVADSSVHADPTAVVAPLQSTNKSNPPPGNIMEAQNRLIELGFLAGPADGVWGTKSRMALRAFKIANALTADDKWDDLVSSRLYSTKAARSPLPLATTGR